MSFENVTAEMIAENLRKVRSLLFALLRANRQSNCRNELGKNCSEIVERAKTIAQMEVAKLVAKIEDESTATYERNTDEGIDNGNNIKRHPFKRPFVLKDRKKL